MNETYKSDYEAAEAQHTSNLRKNEESRMDTNNYAGNTEHAWTCGKITTKVMNMICSKAVDYNKYPVDMGYTTNNLNSIEFKNYAEDLMAYTKEHPLSVVAYADETDRNKRFYHLRDANKRLIDDSVTAPMPEPKKAYPIPTDTDIKLRNDAELLELAMQTIEELSQRILIAREAVKNDIDLMDTIVAQLPKSRAKKSN